MGKPRYTPLRLPVEFDAGLDRRPADWDLRSVASKWLEEQGDQMGADCLRWQVRFRKRPDRSTFHQPEGNWSSGPNGPPDNPLRRFGTLESPDLIDKIDASTMYASLSPPNGSARRITT